MLVSFLPCHELLLVLVQLNVLQRVFDLSVRTGVSQVLVHQLSIVFKFPFQCKGYFISELRKQILHLFRLQK